GRPLPGIVGTKDRALASLKPATGETRTFVTEGDAFRIAGEKGAPKLTLEPFYGIHGKRHYQIYWDVRDESAWSRVEAEHREEVEHGRSLDALTIDRVLPGDEASEREHGLRSASSDTGEYVDRRYRDAAGGGWFSYELRVSAAAKPELVVTYW